MGNVIKGPGVPAIDESTRKEVTLVWRVLLISVGNWEGDNIELQLISKSILLVSVQLHDDELGHKLIEIDGWIDYERWMSCEWKIM